MARFPRVLGLTAAAAALAAITAFAQTPTPPAGVRQGPRHDRLMAGLNLTDAQREQIRTLRNQHQTAMREQMQQLREARRALRSEVFADAPDQTKVEALKDKVAALSQQVETHRLELQQQIAQVLTPEQRQKMREHQPRMRGFRGRARGRF